MRETRITQWLAAGLILAAATLIGVKWLVAGITPGRTVPPMWHVNVRLGFRSTSPVTAVRLFVPRGGEGHAIADEHFRDDALPRHLSILAMSRNRSVRWRETRLNESHLIGYSAWFDTGVSSSPARGPTAAASDRLRRPTKMIQSRDAAIRTLAESLVAGKSGDERITAVLEYVHGTIADSPDTSAVSAVKCLKAKAGSPRSRSRLVCALLRSIDVPCQLVGGVLLDEDVRTHAFYWVEAWDGRRWVTLDPMNGRSGQRLADHLPIFRGDYSWAKFRDCEDTDVLITVELKDPPPRVKAQVARRSPNIFDRLSLASLPADTQELVKLLLLLPVGALVVAGFRNLIGVSTFGIFMPILLALAFRETHLAWGFFYLAMLVGVGVVVRGALNRLKLLMIPRLATVLTLIVSLMIGLIFIGSRLGLQSALSVGLFPMVIMTTAVERFFVLQSEDGTAAALKESLTTALVASCGFLIFQWNWLRSVLFVYPELLLVVVALLVLLGRYSGFRLMELRRFRSLAWGSTPPD